MNIQNHTELACRSQQQPKQHSTDDAQEVTESLQFKRQVNENGIWQHTKPRFPQLRTVNTINIPITRSAYTVLQFSEGTELHSATV